MQRLHRLIGNPGLRTISTQYLLLLIPAISLLFITLIGDTGYLVMMDQSGMIISHPRKELILNARARQLVRPVMDRIRAGETWFLSSFEGKRNAYYVEKLTTVQFNMQDNWYICLPGNS